MNILLTGAAGFIGFHLARRLLERGDTVVGLDDLNAYYDVSLKEARLAQLRGMPGFEFVKADLADRAAMERVFDPLPGPPPRGRENGVDPLPGPPPGGRENGADPLPGPHPGGREKRFDAIVNLAAQAGVRYSIENPYAYVDANVVGFLNVLEGARRHGTGHLVFASTSSIYGLNTAMPFAEGQNTDHPVSLYAATKKANEHMAHSYAHLFGIPCTGLRFFTVYGPWGRPDMALFKFARGILAGEPIPVFNEGKMIRDFTYVDDIVEGVVRVIDLPPIPNPAWDADHPDPPTSSAPWRVFNIGNNRRVELMAYIRALEDALGKKAKLDLLPMQPGDVRATEADTTALEMTTGFRPATPVEEGVRRFVEWYRSYYGV